MPEKCSHDKLFIFFKQRAYLSTCYSTPVILLTSAVIISIFFQDFERWIISKENALETESSHRQSAEAEVERLKLLDLDQQKGAKIKDLQLNKTQADLVNLIYIFTYAL
jgi:hypothetical protein